LEILLQRLLERINALALLYGPGALPSEGERGVLAQTREVALAETSLRWAEWSRASGRTGQVMPWGDLLGEVLSRRSDGSAALAGSGRMVACSKTSFGLGHYRLWSAPG
jgi:hypothetical protein